MNSKYCFIGDVHSQDKPLKAALDSCEYKGYAPILLGDLFDSRNADYSDSYNVYVQANRALEMGGYILQSNHQNKLIRYLKGRNVQVKDGLEKTIDELFSKGGLKPDYILNWLESFPFAVKVRTSKNEYRAAHAFFPNSLKCDNDLDFQLFYENDLTKYHKSDCMYGITKKTESGMERVAWWNDNSYAKDFIRVGGHYHEYIVDNYWFKLIDGECGTEASNARLVCMFLMDDGHYFENYNQ